MPHLAQFDADHDFQRMVPVNLSWPGPPAERCRGFLLNFGGIFAGDFPAGFFWALFQNEEKKSGDKIRDKKWEKSEKSVLPKTDPKISPG